MKETQHASVLHVLAGLNMGGIETIVISLYQNINREKVHFDFVLHSLGHQHYIQLARELGSKIYVAPQFKKVGPWAYIRWWNRFFKEHPEYKVVHGHMVAYMTFYLGMAKYHKRIAIAHSHNVAPKENFILAFLHKFLQYPLRRIADYHFACSIDAGKYLYGKDIIKKNSFHFIPNARDTKVFVFDDEKSQAMRQKLNLTDKFVIGNVGRFDEQKNHEFLIRIFEKIYQHNPQARLLLLGDGKLQPQIRQQVVRLGLTNAVLFMDVVPNPQDYYQAMDVFLFPSLYEGLGMVLTEAQIAGLPCVFSANLPQEIEIVPELCHRVNLKESAEKWAEITLAQQCIKRISHMQEAAAKGFEITALSKRLEDFYIQGNR